MIACPSCGRDNVGVWNLAERVEERLKDYPQHFEVAVMGCAVNGPGRRATPTSGSRRPRHGVPLRARPRAEEGVVGHPRRRALPRDRPVDRRGHRPKRLKMAKPAARDGRSVADPIDSLRRRTVRASQLFLPTLREAPRTRAVSHKLLVRGAFIRQVSAGLWTFLPLGWRVHERSCRSSARSRTRSAGRRCSCQS